MSCLLIRDRLLTLPQEGMQDWVRDSEKSTKHRGDPCVQEAANVIQLTRLAWLLHMEYNIKPC